MAVRATEWLKTVVPTSAEADRAFSSVGNVVAKLKARLKETANVLVFFFLLMKNHLREKRQLLCDDLWSHNCRPKIKSDQKSFRGMRRPPQCFFFEFFIAIILLEIIAIVCEKNCYFLKI